MDDNQCNLFEICKATGAPLCPLQENTVKHGIWYPDEAICQSKQFESLSWIKKQKQIVRLKLTADDGFFTVRMLNDIHIVTAGIKGADPNENNAESKWLTERAEKRASHTPKKHSIRKKEDDENWETGTLL